MQMTENTFVKFNVHSLKNGVLYCSALQKRIEKNILKLYKC